MGFPGSAETRNAGAGSRARASPRRAADGERSGGRGSGGRAAVTVRTVIGRVLLFPSGSAKVTGRKAGPPAAQLYLFGVSVELLRGRLQLSLTLGRGPRCGLACVPLSFGPCCAQRSFWTWWRLPWGPGARWPGQGCPGPQRSGVSRTTPLGFCGHRPPDTSSNGSVDVRAGALWPPVPPAAPMMQ